MKTFLLILWLCLSSSISLLAQVLDPNQARDILQQLEALKSQREELMKQGVTGALQQIRAAAGSDSAAKDFFEDAVAQTEFAGQNREQGKFREWKEKHENFLKLPVFPSALRLHLNYLALTLERASGKKNEEMLPALIQHAAVALAIEDKQGDLNKEQREFLDQFLRKSVADSVFSNWLRLKDHLGKIENWEMVAGNAEGIYGQSVLPLLRKNKDPQLLQYWDARIERAVKRATGTSRTFDAEKLATLELPNLRWQRAQDALLLGQAAPAVAEMLSVIKTNPGHPQAEDWIRHLVDLVQKASTAPSPTEPATAAPALPPSS